MIDDTKRSSVGYTHNFPPPLRNLQEKTVKGNMTCIGRNKEEEKMVVFPPAPAHTGPALSPSPSKTTNQNGNAASHQPTPVAPTHVFHWLLCTRLPPPGWKQRETAGRAYYYTLLTGHPEGGTTEEEYRSHFLPCSFITARAVTADSIDSSKQCR